MSADHEIDEIVEENRDDPSQEEFQDSVALAAQEVANLLSATGDSFEAICAEIETATSPDACRSAFRRFNSVLRIFLLTAGHGEGAHLQEAIRSLGPSERFQKMLEDHPSVSEAIALYKETMLRDLAASIRSRQPVDIVSEQNDEQLFARILQEPKQVSEAPKEMAQLVVPLRKRRVDELADDSLKVPAKKQRSSIPALSAWAALSETKEAGSAGGKKMLLTREKLRSGLHDPKRLLDLAGPSTSWSS